MKALKVLFLTVTMLLAGMGNLKAQNFGIPVEPMIIYGEVLKNGLPIKNNGSSITFVIGGQQITVPVKLSKEGVSYYFLKIPSKKLNLNFTPSNTTEIKILYLDDINLSSDITPFHWQEGKLLKLNILPQDKLTNTPVIKNLSVKKDGDVWKLSFTFGSYELPSNVNFDKVIYLVKWFYVKRNENGTEDIKQLKEKEVDYKKEEFSFDTQVEDSVKDVDFFKVVVRVEGFIGEKKIDSPAGIYTVVPVYSEGNI